MNYVPRCAVCWRMAVAHARHEEEAGRDRPRAFDVYLTTYRRNHIEGPGPFKTAHSEPLEVPGFGRAL